MNERNKNIYVLWEKVEDRMCIRKSKETIIGAFNSLDDLINHVKSGACDQFTADRRCFVRVPGDEEFVAGQDIPIAHEVNGNFTTYCRFEQCEWVM